MKFFYPVGKSVSLKIFELLLCYFQENSKSNYFISGLLFFQTFKYVSSVSCTFLLRFLTFSDFFQWGYRLRELFYSLVRAKVAWNPALQQKL